VLFQAALFQDIHGFIELDDGKIFTGKPKQFDGKKPMGFRCRFSQQNQSIDGYRVASAGLSRACDSGESSCGSFCNVEVFLAGNIQK
jgi:hypothetical protein